MPNTREKLEVIAHLSDHITYKEGIGICYDSALAKVIEDAYMTLKNGVTVQECKVVEIDRFKLPVDDAILILKEEHKQRVDGYTTHLSYGGESDPAEEVHLDALEMAIAALEWQKTNTNRRKENDYEQLRTGLPL